MTAPPVERRLEACPGPDGCAPVIDVSAPALIMALDGEHNAAAGVDEHGLRSWAEPLGFGSQKLDADGLRGLASLLSGHGLSISAYAAPVEDAELDWLLSDLGFLVVQSLIIASYKTKVFSVLWSELLVIKLEPKDSPIAICGQCWVESTMV